MPGYDPSRIEKKWQARWAEEKTFATNSGDHSRPKFYVLDMFPYPSGQGLHVGHPEGYTATDIVARYKRAKGFNVMHPMGWDAFGLPAEQYAIKNNVHPRETTANNINRFRQQLQSLGFSYDWDREVDTTDPGYYRWTQWIFLKLYDTWFDEAAQKGRAIGVLVDEFRSGKRDWRERSEKQEAGSRKWDELSPTQQRQLLANYRLAYEAEVPVNWCPGLGTVLANEEVIDGKSEVGGFPVERRPMKQWMLRITAYSERLIVGLDKLEWSDSLKEMQRNWIGKSEGAEVNFALADIEHNSIIQELDGNLTVFTTRPDTLWGATYMVIAPEHELAKAAAISPIDWSANIPDSWKNGKATPAGAVQAYQKYAASRSDRERQEEISKTGVFTGLYAINPVSQSQIPIFISDYVLMGYGTGAIMAVPAHDERDWEFARQFSLPIRVVVEESAVKDLPEPAKNVYYQTVGQGSAESLWYGDKSFSTKEEAMLWYYTDTKISEKGIIPVLSPSGTIFIEFKKNPRILPKVPLQGPFQLINPMVRNGFAANSPGLNGLPTDEAKEKMIQLLEQKGIGKRRVNYKIRDWLFSRQRYWGEPFPLVHLEDGTTVRLADSELPVRLPELADFKPTGTIDPPLSKATAWKEVWVVVEETEDEKQQTKEVARVVPAGTPGAVKARRELNTMPQWAGSCWYYIRYLDARNSAKFVDPAVEKYWLGNGVDLYVGGVEHAVLHLLYSRFWHKVLFDWGLVSCEEPFRKLVNQGLILGESEFTVFKTEAGELVGYDDVEPEFDTETVNDKVVMVGKRKTTGQRLIGHRVEKEEVEKKGEGFVLKEQPGIRVDSRSFKMSKSRGNVVNPDDVIAEYGADSLRLFEMFMGPLEQVKPWSTAGVEGVYRFLQRVWRNLFDENDAVKDERQKTKDETGEVVRGLHRLIKKVGEDIERLSFNTAIAAMMEFNNLVGKAGGIDRESAVAFVRLLEPFAPHFAEEVHARLGGEKSISKLAWPAFDPSLLVESTLEIPVQVNGKLRSRVTIPGDADEATIIAAALADAEVRKFLDGKDPKKKIYVKGRMVNLVV